MGAYEYKSAYNLYQYKDNLDNLIEGYNNILLNEVNNSNNYTNIFNYIKKYREKEQKVLNSIFGVNSIEELNIKLNETLKACSQINNLSGKMLKIPQLQNGWNSAQYLEAQRLINDLIRQKVDIIKTATTDEGIRTVINMGKQQLFRDIFTNFGVVGKGNKNGIRYSSKSNTANVTIRDGKHTLDLSFTPFQIDKIMGKRNLIPEIQTIYEKIENYGVKQKVTINNNGIEIVYDYLTLTGSRSSSDAKKLDKNQIQEINQQVTNLILGTLNFTNAEDRILIQQILNEIIAKDSYVYFIGKNVNGIIGLLGEIQALFLLRKMFKNKNVSANWQANDLINSQKKHTDILLQYAGKSFGIQVKNSTKQSNIIASFTEKNLNTLINELDIPKDIQDLIKNYYSTKSFNVKYQYNNKNGYYEVSNFNPMTADRQAFQDAQKELLSMQSGIEKYFALFIEQLMYATSLEEITEGTDSNSNMLWLVSGTEFYSFSQILENILIGMKNSSQLRLHVSAYIKKNSSLNESYTIVQALNSGKYKMKHSSDVSQRLYFKSAYRF